MLWQDRVTYSGSTNTIPIGLFKNVTISNDMAVVDLIPALFYRFKMANVERIVWVSKEIHAKRCNMISIDSLTQMAPKLPHGMDDWLFPQNAILPHYLSIP